MLAIVLASSLLWLSLHVFTSSMEAELQEASVWNASGKIFRVKPQMTLNQTEQYRWLRPSSIFHIR